ncbi:SUZ RNA-binding domain-containing isoform X9 [Oryctolagus cuniculus]|uniref:SUZ RNA-binding domain-containing isoform X9 n=1 Tax=Oryctolagus cuniculus TaxID=9986 RepID=UPI00222F712E|nr:SUZ domain-containing protein 1 isoform X7 [Oryctolagus cuniculus]
MCTSTGLGQGFWCERCQALFRGQSVASPAVCRRPERLGPNQAVVEVTVTSTGMRVPERGRWRSSPSGRVRKSKSPPKVPIVIQDDSLPTGPPPQIRILKRPTSNGVVSSPNSTSRPALPVKSLAQREAEYAEARKRILGSASPEEEQEKPILDRPTRISQPEDSRQPNNVIRQPLGPDGSQGFKQRR